MLLGIAVCSVSTTPIIFLVTVLRGIVGGQSVEMALNEVLNVDVVQLAIAWAVASLAILPVLALVASMIHRLGRRESDTWLRSIATGSIIGFIAIVVMVSLVLGEGPEWNFRGFLDMAAVMLMSAMINALYWVIAVRPIRHARTFLRQHHAAIQAME
jgi:predicted membrane protein